MFSNAIFITILLTTCVVIRNVHCAGCHVRLQSNLLPEQSPIYLRRDLSNKFHLYVPDNRGISLNVGEEIFLACADLGNRFILNRNVDITPAYCVDGIYLNIFGRKHSFGEIACVNPIRGTVVETNSPCGKQGGVVKHIGFSINNGREFIDLIRTCYNTHTGEAMFASHILYHPKVWERLANRPFFGTTGAGKEVDVIRSYKQTTQNSTFRKWLGTNQYIYSDSYLSRGHLAPAADFPFATWKAATFYFINVVPEWFQVNSGNWETIERMVRDIAHNSHENLYVVSGAYDILTLPDERGTERQLFLDQNRKIPVPKYLWKIVINTRAHAGIVFVALNNPFESRIKHLDFCTDVCDKAGYGSDSWSNATAGLVICCSVDEFMKKVTYLPNFGQVDGLLNNV